eukprot:850962-Alexandrium_andersonii.AAC.1
MPAGAAPDAPRGGAATSPSALARGPVAPASLGSAGSPARPTELAGSGRSAEPPRGSARTADLGSAPVLLAFPDRQSSRPGGPPPVPSGRLAGQLPHVSSSSSTVAACWPGSRGGGTAGGATAAGGPRALTPTDPPTGRAGCCSGGSATLATAVGPGAPGARGRPG